MKQTNAPLFFIILISFSSHICLSMEKHKSRELTNFAANNTHNNKFHDDINSVNNKGLTPLHNAIFAKNIARVTELIDKGVNVNIQLIHGNPLDKSTNRIYTPLHCAAQVGNSTIISLLLAAGAHINSTHQNDECTPLHLAAWFGYPDCVQLLIEKGADIHKTNLKGKTPAYFAAFKKQSECLKILIENGTNDK